MLGATLLAYARKSILIILPLGRRGEFKAVLFGKDNRGWTAVVHRYVVGGTASLWAR